MIAHVVLGSAALIGSAGAQSAPPPPQLKLLKVGRLLDVKSGKYLSNLGVLV